MTDLRIYADFNGLQASPRNPTRLAVPLDTFGTLRDLANAKIRLRDNLALTIYSDSDETDDLEGQATVYWSQANTVWIAELDEDGVLSVPKCGWPSTDVFLCLTCRTPLQKFLHQHGRRKDTRCPACGESIIAPIAPPQEVMGRSPALKSSDMCGVSSN